MFARLSFTAGKVDACHRYPCRIVYALIAILFVVGYVAIALEHPLKVNKAASALITGMVLWTVITVGHVGVESPLIAGWAAEQALSHAFADHLSGIASILFFLLGAMVVVELMDAHAAFQVITDRITTTDKRTLLWVVGLVTFFLSAALDNLTTAIVMCALLRKLMTERDDIWLYAGAVIIAANAGGAWSPIGDVTTIMLWNDGQITTGNIILKLLVPSLVCLILPLVWLGWSLKGRVQRPPIGENDETGLSARERSSVFVLGVVTLLGVPFFKELTHLPPFVGVMLGLGILWVYTEFIHARTGVEERGQLQVTSVLRRIDHSSILFFLGILVAVSALETAGHLTDLASGLSTVFGTNYYAVNSVIGVLSAIVDNVPLVAAAQGMYPIAEVAAGGFPQDHSFWELLALCAGTGGSILVIGSAAGVAAMGILHIPFGWYLKRIAGPATLGYLGGILAFWLLWH